MIEKSADTKYPINDLLRQRWSPLAFSDQMVEPEKLCSVLEAARWAASSYNEQPWSFIVATKDNQGEFERLLSCLAADFSRQLLGSNRGKDSSQKT